MTDISKQLEVVCPRCKAPKHRPCEPDGTVCEVRANLAKTERRAYLTGPGGRTPGWPDVDDPRFKWVKSR